MSQNNMRNKSTSYVQKSDSQQYVANLHCIPEEALTGLFRDGLPPLFLFISATHKYEFFILLKICTCIDAHWSDTFPVLLLEFFPYPYLPLFLFNFICSF